MTASYKAKTSSQPSPEGRIYRVRGHSVMLDADLAAIFEVSTANLNKAVKRNAERFPNDFMFRLTADAETSLIFQSGISKVRGRGGSRFRPYAFTQEGVAMLSGVLRSRRAIEANIAIMRAFVKMRRVLTENHQLARKLQELENKLIAHDYQIEEVVNAIRALMQPPDEPESGTGYKH